MMAPRRLRNGFAVAIAATASSWHAVTTVDAFVPAAVLRRSRPPSGHLEHTTALTTPKTAPWWAGGRSRQHLATRSDESTDSKEAVRAEDWDNIFDALQTYKAQHGDLRVPSRFIVPDGDPAWRPQTWGLRLGIRVASIRSIGRYVKGQPQRVEALEALGFEWKVKAATSSEAAPAAAATEDLSAPAAPSTLQSSDESSLERAASSPAAASSTRVGSSSSAASQGGTVLQIDAGEADPAGVDFESLVGALKHFVELNKHTNVPAGFVVPDAEPWPRSCRSMPLGMCINQITTRGAYLSTRVIRAQIARERGLVGTRVSDAALAELDADAAKIMAERTSTLTSTGFALKDQNKDEPQSMSKRFERLVVALETYKRLFQSLDVPQHFAVPSDSDLWDEDLWGLRLGSRVNAIRSQGTFVKNNPARRELLTNLGFRWETEAGMRAKSYQTQRELSAEAMGGAAGEMWQARKWAGANPGEVGSAAANPYYRLFGTEGGEDGAGGEMDGEGAAQRPHTFDDVIAALQVWQREFGEYENIPHDFEVPYAGELRAVEAELDALTSLTSSADGSGGGGSAVVGAPAAWATDDFGPNFPTPPAKEGENGASASSEVGGDDSDLAALSASFADMDLLGDLYDGADDLSDIDDVFRNGEPIDGLARFLRGDGLVAPLPLTPEEEAAAAEAAAQQAAFQQQLRTLEWPAELGGLPLGRFVAMLRSGDAPGKLDSVDRRPKLDGIGFTWGNEAKFLHFDYDKLVTSLANFMKIKGDTCVPAHFVVPSTAQWETNLHGYELGRHVNLCRAQKAMLEVEYPHRYQLLTNFGFLWLQPELVDVEGEDAGDPNSANQAAVAAVTSAQGDYSPDAAYWANNFYEEVLSPSEWLRLRTALEKGYQWPSALFGVQDMYDVEAANPVEYDADDFADDDFVEDDEDDEIEDLDGDDEDDEDDEDDLLGGDVFEEEEEDEDEGLDDDDDDDDMLSGEGLDDDDLDIELPGDA